MDGSWQQHDEKVSITVELNGSRVTLEAEPRRTLADALRAHGWWGTRVGCEHGVCGSCTVLLDDQPVRSCLMLAVQADGQRVETVEGLADDGRLNGLQQAFYESGAAQCGFCTPGFLMLATGVLREEPDVEEQTLHERLTSNVCRCTGGVPILQAVLDAQRAARRGQS
jgi:carbon-monoxide dehydrogenase small subunit